MWRCSVICCIPNILQYVFRVYRYNFIILHAASGYCNNDRKTKRKTPSRSFLYITYIPKYLKPHHAASRSSVDSSLYSLTKYILPITILYRVYEIFSIYDVHCILKRSTRLQSAMHLKVMSINNACRYKSVTERKTFYLLFV